MAKDIYDEIIRNLDICGIVGKANNIDVEQFGQLAEFLINIGSRRNEVIEKLDLEQLSIKANSIDAEQLGQLAEFLIKIGSRQNEVIEKLDLEQLSIKANRIEVGQIGQLARLLSAIKIKKCRDALIKKVDLEQLSTKANKIEVGQIEQLARLLNALGDHRNDLIDKLDFVQLAQRANSAEAKQFGQLEALILALEDHLDDLTNSTSADNLIGELIRCPDFTKLTEKASRVDVEQFGQLAHLLNALGKHRDKLIKNLDLVQLAQKASGAEVRRFAQLEALTLALGDHRDELIDELIKCPDFTKLTEKASRADVEQFDQLAHLLNALGDRRNDLIEKLNHNMFVEKANQVDPSNISALSGFTYFLTLLDEECRDKYIREVQWASICKGCPININSISMLGVGLQNLVKQAKTLSDSTGVDDIAKHLRAHISAIKHCIRETHFLGYRGLAKFLWNCNQVNHRLAIEISDTDTMYGLINGFRVYPSNYRGIGELINALYSIDPPSSEFFIKKVYIDITQSINKRYWTKEEEDLKHLIKALYRSVPDFCKRIMADRNLITVDLSCLALDTIYKEVDEEKKVNTAH